MRLLPRRYVIYCLEPEVEVTGPLTLPGLNSKPFEASDLATYFEGDELRLSTFESFLSQGFQGVLVHDGPLWAGYGWVTGPDGPCPPHLPAWIRASHPRWLFYAHTREGYRGRGIQKAMVRQRLQLITPPEGRSGRVYADTWQGNIPSRRALTSVGFQPAGTMVQFELSMPFLGVRPFCWWGQHSPHPPLPRVLHEVGP